MRLLVIEDHPQLRRLLVQQLEEQGYAVDSAADGSALSNTALVGFGWQ